VSQLLPHARGGHCALARASLVFRMDEKRIRTESKVIDIDRDSAGVLFKIVDCARTDFRPRKK